MEKMEKLCRLNASCANAIEAISMAGELLLKSNLCEEKYIQNMITCFKEFGEYIVLDNGIAMPHARPEDGGIKSGFSIVTLKKGVNFGHDEFDPVNIIIGLVGFNSDEHMKTVMKISSLCDNREFINTLNNANKFSDIEFFLNQGE